LKWVKESRRKRRILLKRLWLKLKARPIFYILKGFHFALK
jgi:hypothetical protein